MLYTILVLLHVLVSFLLVVVILLQSSKGGGLAGSAFGGGSSMAFLGARGTATLLTRATTVLAVLFMLNSLGLSFLLGGSGKTVSVTQREMQSGASNLPRVAGEGNLGLDQEPLPGNQQGTQAQPGQTTAPPPGNEQPQGNQPQQPSK
ncbi:MAG: preprotein translocase subunit SecG [bacterium]|nr:preprotein translocase subunit SecG [bacterium]